MPTENGPTHSIEALIRDRWSPLAFLPERIRPNALNAMLEAARWAPSCYNAQPWRFVVAERDTPAFERVFAALVSANQVWAAHVGALIVVVSQDRFHHNDKPNRWSGYDTGAASFSLCLQAAAEGYATHQMGGFDGDALATAIDLPEHHTLMSVLAVGRIAPASTLPDAYAERERQPRQRLDSIGFSGRFGTHLVPDPEVERVLSFWFGEQNEHGMSDASHVARWWKADPDFDAEIRAKFGDLYDRAARGELTDWVGGARSRLALIVLFDQFSRNLHRDTAAMYTHDEAARQLCIEGIEEGLDGTLGLHERSFFYMPLMHSEDLEDQELAVALFEALLAEAPETHRKEWAGTLDFAIQHRTIIEQWGRFPHRNQRLARPASPAEARFLETPGSAF